jgi:hypothetical protein
MDRTFYYIGIAFFGIINGLFNQTWLLLALIHAQILSPALLFGSVGLTLMFASLMVSTATIIVGGIPAALYERVVGAKDDSTEASLWIWLAGHRHPDPAGDGKFLRHRSLNFSLRSRVLLPTPACDGVAGGFAAECQLPDPFLP